jgi:uncharacterized protein (TIGR03067 family)
MLLLLSAVVLAAGFVPAPPPRPNNADFRRLRGTWLLVSATVNGRPGAPDGGWRWVVAGGRLRWLDRSGATDLSISLDASSIPRRCDLKGRQGVCRGIYSFDGDTLKFCANDDGQGPPEAFDGPGRGKFLFVFQREKGPDRQSN